MVVDYVSIDVIVKGTAGILVPLGLENYLTGQTLIDAYNLISVALILFFGGFSSQKSEAAFCVATPLVAGMLMLFGWFRGYTATETAGMFVVLVMMGLLGVFIYMTDQNRATYGSGGPGSKIVTIAVMLALFGACYSFVSYIPMFQESSVIPTPGSCAAGLPCDEFNNIDFSTTSSMFGENAGLGSGAISLVTALPGAILAFILVLIKIIAGVFLFPVMLGFVMEGVFPGITSNPLYLSFLVMLEVALVICYVVGLLAIVRGESGSAAL
jgi:hypothetical protein